MIINRYKEEKSFCIRLSDERRRHYPLYLKEPFKKNGQKFYNFQSFFWSTLFVSSKKNAHRFPDVESARTMARRIFKILKNCKCQESIYITIASARKRKDVEKTIYDSGLKFPSDFFSGH